jgi:succinate dehydrogenase / fumarate reductase cytochrome b subunit
MSSHQSFFTSTVGSKLLVAVTGLAMFGFLILHLIGNLTLYLGPDTFNHYGHKLISNPLVYPAEAGLIAIFVLHVWKTIRLTLISRSARPERYRVKKSAGYTTRKSLASTTMIVSGLFLLVFVPLHVATFKFGAYYATAADTTVRDLYRLVVEIFSRPGYVAFYVVSMIVVGFHLWHGISSSAQTLGADTPTITPRIRVFGWVMAIVIGGGFLTIPLWLFFFGGRS